MFFTYKGATPPGGRIWKLCIKVLEISWPNLSSLKIWKLYLKPIKSYSNLSCSTRSQLGKKALGSSCLFVYKLSLFWRGYTEVTPKTGWSPGLLFFLKNFVFKTQSFVSFLCNHWEKACLFLSTKESERPCSLMSNSYVVHADRFWKWYHFNDDRKRSL